MLTLLGITSEVSLGGYGALEANEEFRYISIAFGFSCIAAAIFVYYRPPGTMNNVNARAPNTSIEEKVIPDWIPEEMLISWSARRDYLTESQRKILTFAEQSQEFSLSTIAEAFPDHKNKELFYRLEQIRLLGFIILDRP